MHSRLLSIPRCLALAAAVATAVLAPTNEAQACQTPSLVSTDWLADHLDRPDLVLVDVRTAAEYAAGHIAGSINIPFAMPTSAWIVQKDNLLLEVPPEADLFATLGAAGIDKHSFVVVVNNATSTVVPPSYPRAQTARVATTLIYAGVRKVAILDGGITKWAAEAKPQSTAPVTPTPTTFNGRINERIFVSKQYVEASLGNPNVVLLDVRDAAVYAGTVVEPYAPRPGHIPGAKSLPSPYIWNDDGTYKTPQQLRSMVTEVVGHRPPREIIVYCGVGGYASGWWFALTEILGYRNVKFYDGSAQEWVADPNAPLELD